MDRVKGKLMSKDAFLYNVPYTKEPYEGILVSADTKNNQYKIAVQLSENQVLIVDQVNDREVQEKLREWVRVSMKFRYNTVLIMIQRTIHSVLIQNKTLLRIINVEGYFF